MNELISNHPLFPLLVMVFEKCELATHSLPTHDRGFGSFAEDLQTFIEQFQGDFGQYEPTTHPDIDHLMIEAIRVLHIHLLELEKVNELCETFVGKYIHLLKEQLSTQLAMDEMKFDEDTSFEQDDDVSMSDETINDENRPPRKKRGIFPKTATSLMRAWLFDHLQHPYPSDDEKRKLAEATQLSVVQVNNWFINARRRIVQPMIDQSNRMVMFEGMYQYGPVDGFHCDTAM